MNPRGELFRTLRTLPGQAGLGSFRCVKTSDGNLFMHSKDTLACEDNPHEGPQKGKREVRPLNQGPASGVCIHKNEISFQKYKKSYRFLSGPCLATFGPVLGGHQN